jgi:hypothetical protein
MEGLMPDLWKATPTTPFAPAELLTSVKIDLALCDRQRRVDAELPQREFALAIRWVHHLLIRVLVLDIRHCVSPSRLCDCRFKTRLHAMSK